MTTNDSTRWVTTMAFIILTTLVLHGQTVDFSGTWVLDVEASDIPAGPGGGGRRGGRGGGPGRGAGGPVSVAIQQSPDALVIEAQGGRGGGTLTYRLDGRESVNATRRGEMATTSAWEGAELVTTGTMEMSTPRGEITVELHERRSLSDDGSTMTVETTRSTPRGEIVSTLVYRESS